MKRILALVLCCLLLCASCASILERDYLVSSDHAENPPAQTQDYYRVETYPALVSALTAYVEEGMETGVLRFPTTYDGNLTVDLERARRQLMEETPYGAYALTELTYHSSRIISYYEVTLAFRYRPDVLPRTQLTRVTTPTELDNLLTRTLTEFGPGFTVLLLLPGDNAAALQTSLDRCCDKDPTLAPLAPVLSARLYPEGGAHAVAEVSITYPESFTQLLRLRQRLLSAAEELTADVEPDPARLLEVLHTVCVPDPAGGSTAAALLEGAADREGMARAFQLLCRAREVPCDLLWEGGLPFVALPPVGGGETLIIDPSDPLALTVLEELSPEDASRTHEGGDAP